MASVIGFIKLLSLAYLMPVYEYGQYIAYFGVATLSATLISMGLVEKTIKAYPRQWVNGQRNEIIHDAVKIAAVISTRFFFACMGIIILSFFELIPVTLYSIILTIVLSLCTSVLALLGSLYRAAGSQKALQNFTWWRSFATLCIALPAGALFGWQGALAGEIVANLVGITIGTRQLKILYQKIQLYPETTSSNCDVNLSANIDRGHFQLYFANLAVLFVTMVDKAWLGTTLGPSLVGSYGIVMLIPQVSQLIVNVIAQYTGPLIIKLAHLKKKSKSTYNTAGLQAGLLALFAFTLVFVAYIAKRLPYLDHIFQKYSISDGSLFIAGLIAAGQIYSVLEFHLIAFNREKDVLKASIVSFVIFIVSFGILTLNHAAVEWFIGAIALSRWSQVLILRSAYLRYV